jgi:hypothetical protein
VKRAQLALGLALLVALAAPEVLAAPVRILIAVGAPTGLSDDQTLVHPRDDARGVVEVLTALGGVSPRDALLVPDARVASVRAAFDRAEAIARGHAAAEVTFVFYFSGHGDHEALHLSGETLSLGELRARVERMPVALRLVIIDACRVSRDRAKGMTGEPGFAISLAPVPSASGTAWLFASSDGEVAQESDEIGGALFSHFWTTGLRGAADADGDGRVTLQESFDFAYAQTLLRSARSGAVLQRPQERLDLSVAGPVVLTQLAARRSTLVLPPDRDALYLVYGIASRGLEAELFGSPDRSTALALPAGRYLVQRRFAGAGGAAEVLLKPGDVHTVDPETLHPFEARALALKSDLVVSPWSLTLSDGVVAGSAISVGNEAMLEVERRWGNFGFAVRALGGRGENATPANEVYETSLGGEAGLVRILPLGARVDLRLGVDVRAEYIRQEVERKDAAVVEAVGYPGVTYFNGSAWGGGLHAEARYQLSTTFHFVAAVKGLALESPTDAGTRARFSFGGYLGVGASF